MNEVYLCLGGNMGNREEQLNAAIQQIQQIEGVFLKKNSSVYETGSWGNVELPSFLNQVILIEYSNEPQQLMKEILEIENKLGRTRNSNSDAFESRSIDIDILFFGDKIINSANLVVPHPRLHQRKFVLVPLNELNHEIIHPILKLNMQELLMLCKDKSSVIQLKVSV